MLEWYERHGRAYLPWRREREPYRVVVSEFMLQQTQVDRVLERFEAFLTAYPSFAALAAASQADIVRAWKGLGYNSRAVRLHRLARAVRDEHGGVLPHDPAALRALPGVGPYTAAALEAFAFDGDAIAFDTNVRRVTHRTLFGLEWPPLASDRELERAARELVPGGRGRDWNAALMDLGATICTARAPKCLVCPLRERCRAAPVDAASLAVRARAATAASPARPAFEATARYLRGRVVDALRELDPGRHISLLDLARALPHAARAQGEQQFASVVERLIAEGVVLRVGDDIALRE